MAKKKQVKVIHPLTALDALAQFNSDVSVLLSASQNAISFLTMEGVDPAKAAKAVVPELQRALDEVRRHYEDASS